MRDLDLTDCRLDGRYDIRKTLGRGSYAEIYLAEDSLAGLKSPHRHVVIKALNVFLQSDLDPELERTLVENFQNEALALDRVRHPNIISRLGHGTAQDLSGLLFHFLVLEYLPGGDLAKFARKRRLTLGEALDFLEQVCAALAHAHSRNVIHRDIKPQNLLLSEDHKVVKIADFGVARLSESDSPITRVGTNLYAAPEHSPHFSGMTGKLSCGGLTPAADVYSLAKTAYVLITGESPRFFTNGPITALPQHLRTLSWSNDLLSILSKATRDEPSARHPNALAFWEEMSDLRKYADAPVPASLEHKPPRPSYTAGYNPTVPLRPRFDTARDLKLGKLPVRKRPGTGISILESHAEPPDVSPPAAYSPPAAASANSQEQEQAEVPGSTKQAAAGRFGVLKRPLLAAAMIAVFAAGLYATYNYVLTRVPLPSFSSLFGSREATALMNINLRSGPGTENPRIGLVSEGSRLRIVSNEGNWYRIEVLQYGAPKTHPEYADQGWISGKTRTGLETIAMKEDR